jgi:hypothetical protein
MRNTLILLLVVTTAALASVCVVEWRKSSAEKIQAAALRGELAVKSQQMEQLEAAHQGAERERRKLADQADVLSAQLQASKAATNHLISPASLPLDRLPVAEKGKPGEEQGGFGKMVAKMMDNPDTRQFMRDQQRLMVDSNYGALIKQMGLTPDEAAKFKDMLTDNNMKAAEKAFATMNNPASTNTADMFKGVTAQQASLDEQLKAFLGDDRYGQYKAYQETLPDRMMLNQFKTQAGSDYNLTDVQSEALLGFMKEERKSVAASTGLPVTADKKNDPAALQALMSGEKVDEIIQAQQTINQRVYERARTILSQDQLDTLGRFQTNQVQMTRMGMRMMKTVFGPQKVGAGTGQSP